MKLLTSKEERKIMMKQPRYVSRLEKIAFPVVMALIVNIFLPPRGTSHYDAHAGQSAP